MGRVWSDRWAWQGVVWAGSMFVCVCKNVMCCVGLAKVGDVGVPVVSCCAFMLGANVCVIVF